MKYARVCILMSIYWPFTDVVGHCCYAAPIALHLVARTWEGNSCPTATRT